jgi:hypothetical protein
MESQERKMRTRAFLYSRNGEHELYRRYRQKRDLLREVIAGFLWISLDLPDDTTGEELDAIAEQLVVDITGGSDETTVIAELMQFQCKCFCKAPNLSNITSLARRAISTVNGCNAA